jgi:predicted Rossmann-fold nucleotide-binding protein
VNQDGYFGPCIKLLARCVEHDFMAPRHLDMWFVVARAQGVLDAIEAAVPWSSDARDFAAI